MANLVLRKKEFVVNRLNKIFLKATNVGKNYGEESAALVTLHCVLTIRALANSRQVKPIFIIT